ncbi:MAG: hypothetical protein MR836_06785 [Ruminococcus sp.]|nr:hypothetical protein [Ruminococcus sp.]
MKQEKINKFYTTPISSGPKANAVNGGGKCWFARDCKTGFGAIVVVGGGAAVVIAVCVPGGQAAVVVAVAA